MSQLAAVQQTTNAGKPRKKFSILRLCHRVKRCALEIGATIVFVAWLAKEVWHQLGLHGAPWDFLVAWFQT